MRETQLYSEILQETRTCVKYKKYQNDRDTFLQGISDHWFKSPIGVCQGFLPSPARSYVYHVFTIPIPPLCTAQLRPRKV